MGANMQRQAVPLIVKAPYVGTGMGTKLPTAGAAVVLSMMVKVTYADADRLVAAGSSLDKVKNSAVPNSGTLITNAPAKSWRCR